MRIFSAAGVLDPMLTSKRVAQSKARPARVIFDTFFIWYFYRSLSGPTTDLPAFAEILGFLALSASRLQASDQVHWEGNNNLHVLVAGSAIFGADDGVVAAMKRLRVATKQTSN